MSAGTGSAIVIDDALYLKHSPELELHPPEHNEFLAIMAYSFANGRAPASALAAITRCANGEIGHLRKDAAKALNAFNAYIVSRGRSPFQASSDRCTYRNILSQDYFWDLYLHHGGALAATPGTSNHGWGLAVDCARTYDRQSIDLYGARFGFAKAWSDAPSEWWHIKWKVGTYAAVTAYHGAEPTITPGKNNNAVAVKTMKALLKDAGVKKASGKHVFPPLVMDGGYGPSARKRVEWFQAAKKLKADGIVGAQTWAALKKAAKN